MPLSRRFCAFLLFLAWVVFSRPAGAADQIEFTRETLPNGLEVIYAPLHQAPVVHVRVLYHVGSRDERPDRQGFAHMFEHMMFRGSAHVKPEEHMKLIGMVGGYSNAFTSFDQTVYVNTIPANQLNLALYLEADRMSSFKVSEQIYNIERNVVAEEWRRMQNQPYGTVYEDYFKALFKKHSYRWTPIGNMADLKAAHAGELQEFFNTYYVPNNAVLVIAGDIDPQAAKAAVHKYFAWIPKGADINRDIPAEPPQTEMREVTEGRQVPLPMLIMGYHVPPFRSDDHYALELLSTILGGGDSSRLDRLLVNGANPTCMNVGANDESLEDGGFFGISATPLAGRNPEQVQKAITEAVAELIEKGVTPEELEKAKIAQRVSFVRDRETAEKLASTIGREALIGGDPDRVNTMMGKINALKPADIQAVARKYLQPSNCTVMIVKPDPTYKPNPPVADAPPKENPLAAEQPKPRQVQFPEGYPTQPPVADSRLKATFAKGTEATINGVKVIVMPDSRLPYVTWSLTMRAGSHSDPAGKEGLADLTADLMRRGAGGLDNQKLSEDLESRGISLAVVDGGDHTRLSGSCLTEQLDHAIQRSREVLLQPALLADEFAKLKQQALSSLRMSEARPETAASHELARALFAKSPLGRYAVPTSVESISLDDVKGCYQQLYHPNDAVFVIAGDVSVERGQAMAKKLLDGWQAAKLPSPDYTLTPTAPKMRIILVDRPEGRQSMIRMAARAYDLHSDEKYPGALASSILSSGIDSRLGRYVRAEKGLVYSVRGVFQPSRQAGEFAAGAETKLTTTAECVQAIFKVLGDMGKDGVTATELSEAKLRAVGGMVMGMQTIQQQAEYRVSGILNNYPADYWDRYPERISAVAPGDVGQVAGKYLQPERFTVVVVAPAAAVREQLEKLGTVEVVPMPSQRQASAAQ